MRTARVKVDLAARGYDILVGRGLVAAFGDLAGAVLKSAGRIVIITNPILEKLHGGTIRASLRAAGFSPETVVVPAGERYKSLNTAGKLYGRLLELGADRSTAVVALGGGVIGDLAGFVAATYMRGLPYIQIPTTLLAQVDSSIGGKTAVNHRLAKNIIGAFYQPRLVVIDTEVLATLPRRQWRNGLSEIIKYALIAGGPLLAGVEELVTTDKGLDEVIVACCRFKAQVVREDERDTGRRAILNYGHTIGHALEAVAGYKRYNHGEAVAVGMIGAAKAAAALGLLSDEEVAAHYRLIEQAGLPTEMDNVDRRQVYAHMRMDKKRLAGQDHFILLHGLGRPELVMVEPGVVEGALTELSGVKGKKAERSIAGERPAGDHRSAGHAGGKDRT